LAKIVSSGVNNFFWSCIWLFESVKTFFYLDFQSFFALEFVSEHLDVVKLLNFFGLITGFGPALNWLEKFIMVRVLTFGGIKSIVIVQITEFSKSFWIFNFKVNIPNFGPF